MYALNLVILVYSAYRIYKWKKSELYPLGYRLNFKEDGLFAIFAVI